MGGRYVSTSLTTDLQGTAVVVAMAVAVSEVVAMVVATKAMVVAIKCINCQDI